MRTIPENEIRIVYVRSSGAGGQNVNKVATKAQLHFNLEKSVVFSDTEKARLRVALHNRLNSEGEVVIAASESRLQQQNKETAIEKLYRLIEQALIPKIQRVATKPTYASKKRRIESKIRRTRTKQLRKNVE